MPREFPRSRRVEQAIQRILSEALAGRVRDPRLAEVTITDVRVSRDLSIARVYYTTLGTKPAPAGVADAFKAAMGYLRSGVARELRVRHVPELRFIPDEALERARALEDLNARAMQREDPQRPTEDDGG
jgi:ribosome-binding factor A